MGAVHGDVMRNIVGTIQTRIPIVGVAGVFARAGSLGGDNPNSGYNSDVSLDASRVTPVGPANAPRRWGALACCWLGIPAS